MSFAFDTPVRRRRPSLTPMIDVVFLLLVFFMLAARFGQVGAVPLTLGAGTPEAWTGPPRLVDIAPEGVLLNGRPMAHDALISALSGLMETETDMVLLRPATDTDLQRLVDVMTMLQAAGLSGLTLIEP